MLGSGAGAGMSYSVFFLWENSESTDPVNAHPWLSLSLAPSYLILASYLSTFDRTSLSAAEPGLQHQPDHCQPGMEPASRHGWPQRCHLQGYMQALQLGTWRVCSVWAQCGILPRTVRISGHLCDDPGPARPCQPHFRGGGWAAHRGCLPQLASLLVKQVRTPTLNTYKRWIILTYTWKVTLQWSCVR